MAAAAVAAVAAAAVAAGAKTVRAGPETTQIAKPSIKYSVHQIEASIPGCLHSQTYVSATKSLKFRTHLLAEQRLQDRGNVCRAADADAEEPRRGGRRAQDRARSGALEGTCGEGRRMLLLRLLWGRQQAVQLGRGEVVWVVVVVVVVVEEAGRNRVARLYEYWGKRGCAIYFF